MPQPEYTSTFFPGDCCTMSQTVGHCGIPSSTLKHTLMTLRVKTCERQHSLHPPRLNGSISEANGATSSTP
jgi:hypothetical protein